MSEAHQPRCDKRLAHPEQFVWGVEVPWGEPVRGSQARNAPSTSSSIFFASPNNMRLLSL